MGAEGKAMPCFFGVCVWRSTASGGAAAGGRGGRLADGKDRATLPMFASSCRFDGDKAKNFPNGSIGPVAHVAQWNCAKFNLERRASLVFQGSLSFPTP